MSTISLYPGDNRITLKRMIEHGVFTDAVVCDPPYGLVSVQKRFGKEGAAAARTEGNDGSFARLSGGFMGKVWDGTGIERDPEFWKLVYAVLKPGGYVFAFSGSRTGHWQACAMETAGFIMHPMHGWVFGSGFPKAHAADKAIDKHFGAEREDLGQSPNWRESKRNREVNGSMEVRGENAGRITAPATTKAAQWEGWAYGTQAQKPALEPIYLGQKPFSEKTGAANLLKQGVGAVNIDGCRVPTSENLNGGAFAKNPTPREHLWGEDAGNGYRRGGAGDYVQPEGRHPANLILDGSPEVVAMFPDSKGQQGDLKGHGNTRQSPNGIFGGMRPALDRPARNDSGSAARFFHQFPPDCPICNGVGCETCWMGIEADPLFYHPKAGKLDRAGSKHPTVKPIALMQYLIRHITPPGGIVLDPFAGTGTTGEAALREGFDCILMEAEPEYIEFLESRFGIASPEKSIGIGDLYLQALGF